MTERWRLTVVGASHRLERLTERGYMTVAYVDPAYATEVVDTLNGVPVHALQKQVAIMGDQVEDILARVTRLDRGAR